LAGVDTIVFDKTGTLTLPKAEIANLAEIDPCDLANAGALAAASNHPLARVIAMASGAKVAADAREFPGQGVETGVEGDSMRLGGAAFCHAGEELRAGAALWPDASLIYFRRGERVIAFAIRQALRPDAREVVAGLAARGYAIEILSGDRVEAVAAVARALAIPDFAAALKPADKIARLEELKGQGRRVLMVGDGLNDAPALAAAHVSLSPISASHLAQVHADAVFLGDRLAPVAAALMLARKARSLMLQNLWLSVAYNAIAVPIAISGHATPLVAALAMSGSSILVTLNALRARGARGLAS
jgi:Cu2+-exporting ATPase